MYFGASLHSTESSPATPFDVIDAALCAPNICLEMTPMLCKTVSNCAPVPWTALSDSLVFETSITRHSKLCWDCVVGSAGAGAGTGPGAGVNIDVGDAVSKN